MDTLWILPKQYSVLEPGTFSYTARASKLYAFFFFFLFFFPLVGFGNKLK